MHDTDPTRYHSIGQSFLFQIQFTRGAALGVGLMGQSEEIGGDTNKTWTSLCPSRGNVHIVFICIAFRPCGPSSVGLHGRTELKKTEFGYIHPKV